MSRLTALVLARPLGGLSACLALAVLGLVAAAGLHLNLMPSTRYPALTVSTQLPDASPSEVETLVTRPLEEEVRGVLGLKKLFSRSRLGRSEVTLELDPQADVSAAAQDLRGRLRRLRPELPKDARPPVISQYSPSEQPAAVLGLTGAGDLAAAGDWARRELMNRLRRVEGVAEVVLAGAPEPEVQVECDPQRLHALGLSVRAVALAINRGSRVQPAGHLPQGPWRLPLRVQAQVQDAAQVADMPLLADPQGALVLVGQVASVRFGHRPAEEVASLNGRPVVSLALYQASGANLGRLWSAVRRVLDEAQPPPGVSLEVVYSQAQLLDESLGRLAWMALIAAAAAACVLWFFLRDAVSTLVCLAALPFSLLVALLLARLTGLELDILSLSGLALAMGILLDNAVVVIEAVHARWQAGEAGRAGVLAGVAEVASPIAFATLTTVAGFLPLVLVSTSVRLTWAGFFWGLSLSLMASLLAALALVPLLMHVTARWWRGRRRDFTAPVWYVRLLDGGLARPWLALLPALACLALAAVLAPGLNFQKGSGLATQGLNVLVVLPPGTATEITAQAVAQAESLARGLPGVQRVHSRAGGSQGRVTATLAGDSAAQTAAALDRAREIFVNQGQVQYHVLPLGEGGGQATLGVNLFGPDLEGLSRHAAGLIERLKALPMVQDVVVRQGSPAPELELKLDHRLLGQYGLTAEAVAQEVRAHLAGPVAVRIPAQDREIEVRVWAKGAPEGRASLAAIHIPGPDRRLLPLAELAQGEVKPRPGELNRQDLQRVVRLTLLIRGGDTLAAAGPVRAALHDPPPPAGYAWLLGEEVERIEATRAEMLTGAALALVLVYLIMVAATESLTSPLVVMLAAPLAAAGVVLALRAWGLAVDMPVYLGVIILCGLVVNVGIVMIDAMGRYGRAGLDPRQAARQGALRRLRPVLMTTLSTTAASLPLLLDRGTGSSAWSPLALTLAAGLATSALFALFLTPALYPLAAALSGRRGEAGRATDG
ncbi:MAG: efflux RND transporter permease subunit [Thermodesulfobacteriota bacterium]